MSSAVCPECGGTVKPRRAGRPDTCITCGYKDHGVAAKPAKKAVKKKAKKKVKKKGKKKGKKK